MRVRGARLYQARCELTLPSVVQDHRRVLSCQFMFAQAGTKATRRVARVSRIPRYLPYTRHSPQLDRVWSTGCAATLLRQRGRAKNRDSMEKIRVLPLFATQRLQVLFQADRYLCYTQYLRKVTRRRRPKPTRWSAGAAGTTFGATSVLLPGTSTVLSIPATTASFVAPVRQEGELLDFQSLDSRGCFRTSEEGICPVEKMLSWSFSTGVTLRFELVVLTTKRHRSLFRQCIQPIRRPFQQLKRAR